MINKEQIFDTILLHQNDIEKFGVKSIGLFGSYLKNNATHNSDIDIYIDFIKEKKTFKNYTGAYFYLQNIFDKKIDFITPQSLGKYVSSSILKEVVYAFRND